MWLLYIDTHWQKPRLSNASTHTNYLIKLLKSGPTKSSAQTVNYIGLSAHQSTLDLTDIWWNPFSCKAFPPRERRIIRPYSVRSRTN